MSTTIMGLCWPIQIPPTQKAVLISLADQANDQGCCWPSIIGIAERTCFGRTAVIEAIKWLEQQGLLTCEKTDGRNNRYQFNLTRLRQKEIEPVRQTDQPGKRTSTAAVPVREPDAPRPADVPPPVREADQPVREVDTNHHKPSSEPKRKEKLPAVAVSLLTVADLTSEGVSAEAAAEFMALRKRKKAPLTPLAWAGLKSEVVKAGWTLDAAVRKCIQRNWQGFEAAWVADDGPKGKGAAAETPYQRGQREKASRWSNGAVAAKAPGAGLPPLDFVDMEA